MEEIKSCIYNIDNERSVPLLQSFKMHELLYATARTFAQIQ
jgi:hypothetical protein